MTMEEYHEIQIAIHGSEETLALYNAALRAAHQYAQATDCPAGTNVLRWLTTRLDEVQEAWRAALEQSCAGDVE